MLRTNLTRWQQEKIRCALSAVIMPHVYSLIASSTALTLAEKASLHMNWCNAYARLEHLLNRETDPAILAGRAKLDEALKEAEAQKVRWRPKNP
jgi:hypothetical protein